MGLARRDRSPVSTLNPHLSSFSSSGEDLEDYKPLAPPAYPRYADFSACLYAHTCLRTSLQKGADVQHAIEKSHATIHGLTERLPALQISMSALQSKADKTRELENRIDEALGPPFAVLRLFDKVHHCERNVSECPKDDVGYYIEYISLLEKSIDHLQKECPDALQSLQEILPYLSSSKTVDKLRLHKLYENIKALKTLQAGQENVKVSEDILNVAFEQLETEFRRILTDYGKPLQDAKDLFLKDGSLNPLFYQQSLLPAPVVQLLREIVTKLSKKGRLRNCLEIHEDVRSWKVSENFQSLRPDYLKDMRPQALDSLQWIMVEEFMGTWNKHMWVILDVFLKPERTLFDEVFSGVEAEGDHSESFGRLAMKSGLGLLLKFGETFAKSKKEPQKIFKLLDMFETLEKVMPVVTQVLTGDGCREVRDILRELQKRIVHGACTVFWEFGLQVEVQRQGPPPPDGGVLKLVSYVVNYIKYLISDMYMSAITQVLKIEQSWRGKSMEESELSVLILHIMESLHRNIESRCELIEEAPLSCIFLMNNYWYIYTRSKSSNLGALLGEAWLNEQTERVEHIALQYEREAWGGVVSHLSMDGLHGASSNTKSRELLRQRIKSFHEALTEMHLKHSRWRIPCPELRQHLSVAVLQLVVPAYRSYLYNYSQVLEQQFMSSQPTVENVEKMLMSLFQDKPSAPNMLPRTRSYNYGHANGRVPNYDTS